MEPQQKQQIADRLVQANNILVTVSTNPSVDQLSACIGLTLALNKLGKHAAAVFSGQVPSTIEFLQPEKTIEKNTDSLRDFIIALDKSKADKLRYKVEDKVVKIFITPYKTSISEKDFEFSQGDFNVDVVVALGVHSQADIDQAITAHGRILHDAAVITINTKPGGELGAINLVNPGASSLSELIVQILDATGKKVMDGQMATALLTGIVAETQRFSNVKTSPGAMTISAELMAAGANQQLVATKLEPPKPPPPPPPPQQAAPPKPIQPTAAPAPPRPAPKMQATAKQTEGTLEIEHDDKPPMQLNADSGEPEQSVSQIEIDREGTLRRIEELQQQNKSAQNASNDPGQATTDKSAHNDTQRRILQPPTSHGQPADGNPDPADSAGGSLSLPQPNADEERPSGAPPLPPSDSYAAMPSHNTVSPISSPPQGATAFPPPQPDNSGAPSVPPPPAPSVASDTDDNRTLSQIEQDVGSTHTAPASEAGAAPAAPQVVPQDASPAGSPGGADLSSARDAVSQAIGSQPNASFEPPAAFNALPLGSSPLHDDQSGGQDSPAPQNHGSVIGPAPGYPQVDQGHGQEEGQKRDPNAPPPGPPPMMPPSSQ